MENIYQNQSIRSPITKAIVLGLVAATLLGPIAFTEAAPKEDKENHESNGNAYGHYIAPGYIKNFGAHIINAPWLPPGIAKKLINWTHPGQDTKAPVISALTTEDTSTTATVIWTTNERATSALYLSTTSPVDVNASATIKVTDPAYIFNHSLTATDLVASTTYYGIITTTDAAGNTSTSSPFTLTTDGTITLDTTGPVLSLLNVDAGTTTALVTWTTDELSTSVVYYSLLPTVTLDATTTTKVDTSDLTLSHSLNLTGLTASTTYYTVIASVDASGNTTTSATSSFTTDPLPLADTTAPIITDAAGVAGTSTIVGSWTTNEPATSAIYTSTTTGFALTDAGVLVTEDLTLSTNHSLTIVGLTPLTTYYHRIVTEDAAGNETVSDEFTFGTI